MTREMVVDHHIVMVVVVIMAVIVMVVVVEETGDRRRPMIGEVAERVTMMIDMIDITMMPMIGLQSQRQHHHPHHRHHRQRTHQTVIEGEEVVEVEVVVVVVVAVAVVVVDQRVVDPIEIVSIHGARPLREMITEGRMTEGRLSAVAVVVVVEEREVTVWIRERRIDRREALIRETSPHPPVEVVEEMTLDQNHRLLVVVAAVDVAPPHRHLPPPRSDPLRQEMMVEDVVAVVVAEVTTRAIDIDQVNVTVRDNEDECDNINSKKPQQQPFTIPVE